MLLLVVVSALAFAERQRSNWLECQRTKHFQKTHPAAPAHVLLFARVKKLRVKIKSTDKCRSIYSEVYIEFFSRTVYLLVSAEMI